MAAKKPQEEPAFETELARLEAIADRLETGALPLDQLMNGYEEGMVLAEKLQKQLERTRARLNEVKAGKDGTPSVKPSEIASQASLLDGLEP